MLCNVSAAEHDHWRHDHTQLICVKEMLSMEAMADNTVQVSWIFPKTATIQYFAVASMMIYVFAAG